MRKYAREVAFGLIFEYSFRHEKKEIDLDLFDRESLLEEDQLFINAIYNGVVDNYDTLKSVVADYSKGFKIDRVYKVDLAIIILALYEIKFTDTPAPICINEAVNIAKKYSTEKSVGYVNGLLAQYLRDNIKE